MESKKIPVIINLMTKIDDDGEVETSSTQHAGIFRRAKHADILIYEEDFEGFSIRNLITIKPDSVSIKRSGAIGMHQTFQLKGITENVYQHPHGSMHMETRTERLFHAVDQNSGLLEIVYQVKLNGQNERNHQLRVEYKEEADAK